MEVSVSKNFILTCLRLIIACSAFGVSSYSAEQGRDDFKESFYQSREIIENLKEACFFMKNLCGSIYSKANLPRSEKIFDENELDSENTSVIPDI